jgi:hypothetical protein
LKSVGLQLHDFLQVSHRKKRMINGAIIRSIGIRLRAGLLHDRVALVRGEVLAAAKHHVLEEMRKPALARLDFIARPRPHHDIKRDEILMLGGHGDDAQTIRQCVDAPGIWEKGWDNIRLRGRRLNRHCRHRHAEH